MREKDIKSVAGMVLNGGLILTGKVLSGYDKTLTGGILTDIAGEIGKNFALKHLGDFGAYDHLYSRIVTKHPDKVNHDLERIIKEASVIALDFLRVSYNEELNRDILFFENCDEKEIKNYIKGVNTYFNDAKQELKIHIEHQQIDKNIIESPGQFFATISNYLISVSETTFDEASRIKLIAFHERYLPVCFQLAFKEVLKNDDKGFKAFQIWMLESLREQNRLTGKKLDEINEAVEGLKNGQNQITPQRLDELASKIIDRLALEFKGVRKALRELGKFIQQHFKEQYEISLVILSEVRNIAATTEELLSVTTRSNSDINNKLDQIIHHLNEDDVRKTQHAFSSSAEVLKLILEIDALPPEIVILNNRYIRLKDIYESDPNDDQKYAMDLAYGAYVAKTEKLKLLNARLDDTKFSVMALYQLLYLQNDITPQSETTSNAILLFEQGKFEELEELLSADSREAYREQILREQQLLDEKKKDMAIGDLLNAITILRNRNDLSQEKEAKADLYFRKSIAIFPIYFGYFYYAQYLEDAFPQQALENYKLSLEHVDATQQPLSYVDGLLALGRMESQLQCFDESVTTYDNVIDFLENDTHLPAGERERKLTVAIINSGVACASTFDKDEAKASFLLALERLDPAKASDDPENEETIISIFTRLGDLEVGRQDFEAAREYYETALSRYYSQSVEMQSAMTGLLFSMSFNIGHFHLNIKEYDRAEEYFLTVNEKLLSMGNITPVEKNFQLCHVKHGLAILYFETNRNKEAEKEFRDALSISKKFVDMDIIRFVPVYTGLLLDFANQSQFLNRRNEAEDYYEEAAGLIIKNLDSGRSDLHSQLVSMTIGYTDLLISNGDYNRAGDYLLAALQFLQGITSENSFFFKSDLANILERSARFLAIIGERGQAAEVYERACKEYEFLTGSPSARYVTTYIDLLIDKAEFHALDGQYDNGISSITRAHQLNEKLRDTNTPIYDNFNFKISASQAVLEIACSRFADARATILSMEKFVKKLNKRVNFDDYRAKIARYWSTVYDNEGNYVKAIENHEKCLRIYRNSAKVNPSLYLRPMVEIHYELAVIYEKRKETDQALKSYHAALKLFVDYGFILRTDWRKLFDIYAMLKRIEYEKENMPGYLSYLLKQRAIVVTFSPNPKEVDWINNHLQEELEDFIIDEEVLKERMEKDLMMLKAMLAIGDIHKRQSA